MTKPIVLSDAPCCTGWNLMHGLRKDFDHQEDFSSPMPPFQYEIGALDATEWLPSGGLVPDGEYEHVIFIRETPIYREGVHDAY